ncbi:MAG: YdeI/OmpD-associated family protein [Bacteroidia bacterium]
MKSKQHDEYIAKSAEFAQPILRYFRDVVHEVSPNITETIKWGMPHFEHKGVLCGMAAFKKHCAVFFHKAVLIQDKHKVFSSTENTSMGQLGKITSLKDLPKKEILKDLLHQAIILNEQGIKVEKKIKPKAEVKIPEDLQKLLQKNAKAQQIFHDFSPSHKREYIEWIREAKRPETREKRLATTIEWLTEGKSRNWKYERK